MYNYNYIYIVNVINMNIEQRKTVVLRTMNLALMKYSLLPCGLKHTPPPPMFKILLSLPVTVQASHHRSELVYNGTYL